MRPFATDGSPNVAAALVELLTWHGRADNSAWTVAELALLLIDQAREQPRAG
jgi:hypothetical protein